MRHHHRPRAFALFLALVVLPGAAGAQELHTYTVGLLGGLGGSVDADPGDALDNTGFQLNLAMITDPKTHVVVRLGRLGLDSDEVFGSLRDAELTYATIGGEYRFRQVYYDSGVYLGLGGYRLEGIDGGDQDVRDTSIGLAAGVTGEFRINRWMGVLVEISGHWVDFDEAQIFAMGHGGLAFHF